MSSSGSPKAVSQARISVTGNLEIRHRDVVFLRDCTQRVYHEIREGRGREGSSSVASQALGRCQ